MSFAVLDGVFMLQYRDHDLIPTTDPILVNEFEGEFGFRISQFNTDNTFVPGIPTTIYTLTEDSAIQFRPATFVGGYVIGCDLFGVVETSDGQRYFIGGNPGDSIDAPATVNFADITAGSMKILSNKGNTFQGGGTDDVVDGRGGSDLLEGKGGFDLLVGGKGNDLIKGGNGRDSLFGCEGRDRMFGGNGADLIDPGTGRNIVTLGGGSDTIVFKTGYDTNIVRDFDATNNREKIDVSDVAGIRNFRDLTTNHLTQVGADVHIDDGAGLGVVLENVDMADLGRADFIFV